MTGTIKQTVRITVSDTKKEEKKKKMTVEDDDANDSELLTKNV